MSELRWHPLLGEWVIIADERRARPFLPEGACPLCPGVLEIPGEFEVVSFENRYPALVRAPARPRVTGTGPFRVRRNRGVCEVLVYTPEHDLPPSELPLERMEMLIRVWADRYEDLGRLPFVRYVFIFENRGREIGVSLTHPHGQIYAFPFVPPIPRRELERSRAYWRERGRCLFCDILTEERRAGSRVVFENTRFVAFVPFFARFPYEVHLLPKEHVGDILGLPEVAYRPLAEAVLVVLRKYDGLFGEEMPYMMVLHQSPTDGKDHPHYHFHIEFYSVKQGKGRIKYRAGVETGAGTFINALSPERMAEELRRVEVAVDG